MYLKTTTNSERLEVAADLLGLENKNEPAYQQAIEKIGHRYMDLAAKSKEDAKMALKIATPFFTKLGIDALRWNSDQGKGEPLLMIVDAMVHLVGVPLTIGGMVIDIVKFPLASLVAIFKGVQAGFYGALCLLPEQKNYTQQIQDIHASFLYRLRKTILLLCILELERSEEIQLKLQQQDTSLDIAIIALLYTAFDSRNLPSGQLQLANSRILSEGDCPPQGKALFQKMQTIKSLLNKILPSNQDRAIQLLLSHIDKIRALIQSNGDTSVLDEHDHFEHKVEMLELIKVLLSIKKELSKCLDLVNSNAEQAISGVQQATKPLTAYVEKQLVANHGTTHNALQDPITYAPLINPVIANDDVIYSEKTAVTLRDNRRIGVKGIVIRSFQPASQEALDLAQMATASSSRGMQL